MRPISPDKRSAVHVLTSARLHLGFFDLNGNLGRKFGSIGVSLEDPLTEINAWVSDDVHIIGQDHPRAAKMANQIIEAVGLARTGGRRGISMEFLSRIPEHAGLGSGTQLSIAVGSALNALYQLNLSVEQIASLTQRGARSGIGLGTFEHGGVILDGGRGPNTRMPPMLAHTPFPADWRIILILDHQHQGVHGEQEKTAFKTLPVFPEQIAADLCRRILMQAMPALHEQDLETFGAAIRALQEATGDYFAPIQGGRYASQTVSQVMHWCAEQGLDCFGQSSWGPTGFIILADSIEASTRLAQLEQQFLHNPSLEFRLTKGRNKGGFVREIEISPLKDSV